MARPLRNAPVILLAATLVTAAVMILALTWDYTFLQDTWSFLINRREFDADAILQPHNEHIVVIPVLIQQLFLHLFGMDTAKPEIFLLTLSLLATAVLLFVYLSRRVGQWLALFATILILCLGPAWELLLWPFEVSLIGSMLFGLAMLLALEREDRVGDVLACLFLAVSFGFSSLGIPFAVAAFVAVMQSPRERRWGRVYVFLVPLVLYALWYLGWGSEAESHLSARNVLASPRFVAEAMAVGVGNLFGLGTNPIDGMAEKIWGAVLLTLLVIALVWQKLRKPGIDPRFWPVAAAAAANWFLLAFNQMPGRDAVSSRYQYASCIFLLMLAANLLSGERIGRRGVLVGAVVTALVIGPNVVVLENGSDFFDRQTVFTRTDTRAIEIARRTVDPDFQLTPEVAGAPALIDIVAGKYLEAVDEYGSPAYSLAELEAASPEARRQADLVLAAALPLSARVRSGVYDPTAAENCGLIGGAGMEEVEADPGSTRVEVPPGSGATISMRRFASGEYPVSVATVAGGSTTTLRVPRDEAPQPWYLHVEAPQGARVCR
ncbi:MAG: hypothetical protein E6G51_02120 [Actinobacteria bacterium]|nr:MAG: hypothetical protein E6G51_02120 [Actinomycetota bacterium]